MDMINPDRPYQICTRCIMDTTVPTIRFDQNGECNFCEMHDVMEARYPLDERGKAELDRLVADIKKAGEGKKYDVICGTSGGRDSTWTLLLACKTLGLRPLAVHFDNGWNSAIAVSNVHNACEILDIDLETYVADWDEFRDIQHAFLKASTPDVEVPTDVAIHTVMHKLAVKEGVKYIFNGHSFRTEGIAPKDWTYMDGRYIRDVQETFGTVPIKDFQNFNLWDYLKFHFIHRVKVVPILNYFPYDKRVVDKKIQAELGWRNYGGHHHESTYTKFIQSYLLPRKFHVDKRRTENSAMIRSGYMTREEALDGVKDIYPYDPTLIGYVAEKFNLTVDQFNELVDRPVKSFRDYKSYYPLIRLMKLPIDIASRLGIIPRLLYLKFLG
ncbi:N-acetyl sugar amidotransferase [Algimonas porphyrae]|nr:N-acetyl sugar amidotransferase [Algimonas porphyrae]